MRWILPVVLIAIIIAGCAIFIPPTVYQLSIKSGLPQEALDTFNTVDVKYDVSLKPYKEANLVAIQAPSGHYYEYAFFTALDSTLTQWANYKFTGDNTPPDGTIIIEIKTFKSKVENLNKATRDFLYQLGIIAEISVQNHTKKFQKPVVVNLKVAVEGDETSQQQLTTAIEHAILEMIVDIDMYIDRELPEKQ